MQEAAKWNEDITELFCYCIYGTGCTLRKLLREYQELVS